jgi:Protein of unknown function (DUF998)
MKHVTTAAAPVRRPGSGAVARAALAGLCASAVALAAAPALMPSTYSWISDTTSQSAAQGVSGAWLARLGFVLLGLAVTALALTAGTRWGRWPAVLHYAFGACMIAAAAFSTSPWYRAPYDPTEAGIHGFLASTMGVVFAAGVIAAAVHAHRHALPRGLALDITAVTAVVVTAVAMTAIPSVGGAFQRIMFAVAYAWYAAEAIRMPGLGIRREVPGTARLARLGQRHLAVYGMLHRPDRGGQVSR